MKGFRQPKPIQGVSIGRAWYEEVRHVNIPPLHGDNQGVGSNKYS